MGWPYFEPVIRVIHMKEGEKNIWSKIRNFSIDDPNSSFSFTDRLARENSWSIEYASRVILEYKRFLFLICISKQPLTPSDQVDQAWHLHLLYTESYWVDLCQNTLHRRIQHGPTKGGTDEKNKYHDYYQRTKDIYTQTFENIPPIDIWPSSAVRFGEINFSRVNRHKNWVIRKPRIFSKWKS